MDREKYKSIWPIYGEASYTPDGWTGWPNNKQFAFVLTHDVDTRRGEERCLDLMNLEKELGFRSAYFFVPEICKHLTYPLPNNDSETDKEDITIPRGLINNKHCWKHGYTHPQHPKTIHPRESPDHYS